MALIEMVEDEIELGAVDAKKRLSQGIPFLKNRHKPRPMAFR